MELSSPTKALPTSASAKSPGSQQPFSKYTSDSLRVKALPTGRTAHQQSLTELAKRPLSTNITIEPTSPATVPSFRRVVTLLLPIRYSDKFYKESISHPASSALSHVALWCDKPRPGKRKHPSSPTPEYTNPSNRTIEFPEPKVVGGIQCRLEPIPSPGEPEQRLYIQTLAVLSPYRGLGIATHLLDAIIATIIPHRTRVTEIYAHVWEANDEALEWYLRRGFLIEKEVVEGYYRRLRPGGARIVRRKVGIGDYLAARRVDENEIGVVNVVQTEQYETPAANLTGPDDALGERVEGDKVEVGEK